MRFPKLTALLTICSALHTALADCNSTTRLAGAQLIPYSYNLVGAGASAASFAKVPFAQNCIVRIYPNGGPGVLVAIDGTTTLDFAIETRQLFNKVTGAYTDYANGTTIIHTNVTLGALQVLALPVTFYADVYLVYNSDCLIEQVLAHATIPTVVAGIPINPPILDQILALAPVQLP